MELTISFWESIYGAQKEVLVKRRSKCGTCHGSRCHPNTLPSRCWTCYGKGVTQIKTGPHIHQENCSPCGGTGAVVRIPCTACKGKGVVAAPDLDRLKMPPLTEDGAVIEFERKGHETPGSLKGSLFLTVKVANQAGLKRVDLDIVSEERIPVWAAVLGGTLQVNTLDGPLEVNLSEGRPLHSELVLKDAGVKCSKSSKKGNHVVKLVLDTQTELSDDRRKIFEQLAQLEN